jgi:putative ABC transport system permease protein
MKQSPPAAFLRFFRWYCHPRLSTFIEGDLLEDYQKRLRKSGKRKADVRFIVDVILLFRPGIIRSFQRNVRQNRIDMYTSYLKTGWRNLLKNKSYSIINIGGLALGMTVAMFIGLWIYDELSFNKYHENYDRIAQVFSAGYNNETGEAEAGAAVQYPLADVLKNNYGQYFKHVILSYWGGNFILSTGSDKFSKTGEFMDSDAIEMLSLHMLQGNYRSLDKANSIVLSKRLANAIYGDADPMGKVLTINNQMQAEVTGVYDDLPQNNRFAEYEFVAPMSLLALANPWIQQSGTDWDNHSFRLFAEIQPNTSFEAVNDAISDVYKKYVPADFYKTIEKDRPYAELVPMNTWHLYSEFRNGKPATGRIVYVWLFGIVGLFVLILACINFVNLSIARSEKRAREVGVRKAIGSHRIQLVVQFLSESFLVVMMAFVLSMILLALLQDPFNALAGKKIVLPFGESLFWVISAAFVLLTGFFAGLYPAFYLSSFRPSAVLKGSVGGKLNMLPRQVLVVIQFSVSVLIIAGTLIVYRQIQYAQDRPVGYHREGLISIPMNNNPDFEGAKNVILRQELLSTGVVQEASASSSPITAIWNTTGGYDWPGRDPNFEAAFVRCMITMEYGRTIGWEIMAGRDYSPEIGTDSVNAILINEAAAKYMGMEDPVGRELSDIDEFGALKWTKTIIGVVKNVIIESPYHPVPPTLYVYHKDASQFMHVRLMPSASIQEAIPKIKDAVEKVVPSALFDYKFIDEEYAKKFGQEQRIAKLADVFSVLAIFISCLGLFGLASFTAEQRSKEIGIRKVMGASVSIIWRMLTKDFVILVIISSAIAVPAGYLLMNQWLEKYEYRINIPWWIFLVTCFGALLLAVATVSYQSIRAARANPVRNLRTE